MSGNSDSDGPMTGEAARSSEQATAASEQFPAAVQDRTLTSRLGMRFREIVFGAPLIIALAIEIILFSQKSSSFLTVGNMRVILLESAVLGIVAVSAAFLLLAGYVDLSVGSVLALSGVLSAYLMVNGDWNPIWAGLAGIGAGAMVGAINGGLCAGLTFSPIIVTLGMLTAIRGVTYLVSSAPVFDFDPRFQTLGNGEVGGVPIPVIIAGAAFVFGAIFLIATPAGRHVYAIGVNREAAFLSGVRVRRLPFLLFVVSGASAGLAGLIVAARLNSAPSSTLGVGFELNVLTAVLLGGVAFTGGSGNLLGVLAGVLFLGVLQNGLAILNVPFAWQLVASGLALTVSAGLDAASTRLRGGSVVSLRRLGSGLRDRNRSIARD